jgi:hypothetical protein
MTQGRERSYDAIKSEYPEKIEYKDDRVIINNVGYTKERIKQLNDFVHVYGLEEVSFPFFSLKKEHIKEIYRNVSSDENPKNLYSDIDQFEKTLPRRDGEPWSRMELKKLKQYIENCNVEMKPLGSHIEFLAEKHERTTGAIKSKIEGLNDKKFASISQ